MPKSLLSDRQIVPHIYCAEREDGDFFDSFEYKRKNNLVIFFILSPDFGFFLKIEEGARSIKGQNGEIVVIMPLPLPQAEEIRKTHRFSYHIVADPKREALGKFIQAKPGEKFAGLFITDKFGELFFQYVEESFVHLAPVEDIVRSLEFIESQCPECGGSL